MTSTIRPSHKRFLIVFNPLPNKRRKQKLQRVILRLKQAGHDWQLCPTDESYGANKHYFDHNLAEFTDVIVLGGDGTFNLVVNLVQGFDVNVGLIPAGTGNDFARAWYGSKHKDMAHILDVVLGHHVESISLGRCEFDHVRDSESGQSVRYFHNVAGTGFDAALAESMRNQKGIFQSLSYLTAAVRHIPFYKEPHCEIAIGDYEYAYKNLITVFANSRFFGNGMHVAPHADPNSSNLAIVRVEKYPIWTKLALIGKLLMGTHTTSKRVHLTSTEAPIRIRTAGLLLESDGEYIGKSPCRVSIAKNSLLLKR